MGRTEGGDRKNLTAVSAREVLEKSVRAAADLFLPAACVVCDNLIAPGDHGIVCGHCWTRVRQLPYPQCARCGHPIDTHSCRWCIYLPPFVRSARSWCWIGPGLGKDIVHSLKYDGWTRVAGAMAERMARVAFPRDVIEERTALVPVPLAASRLRERGFNQTAVLARALAPLWRIPVWNDALLRESSTRSQTELTPGERLSNVAGAFSVPARGRKMLRGAHVVLLDDVITTGATLRACASALFASGTRTISYMTFGRAPASGDRLSP